MRKDTELFLRKCLQYRDKTGENAFELDVSFFSEIPNIEVEIEEILNELKNQKYISRKSEILGQTIKLYLTLDGIADFENSYKEKEQGIIINLNCKQINFATDNGKVEAKQYERDIRNIPKTISIEDDKNKIYVSSRISGNEVLSFGLVVILILTVIYLWYRVQVQLGLVIASIIIEFATILVYYNSKKIRVIYGKNIKEIAYFNMGGMLCVLLLIAVINSPMYTSKINLDAFKQCVDIDSIVKTILNSELTYYAVFQMMGMLWLLLFMLYITCSDIFIIAVTNIVAGSKGKWLWEKLFKWTYKRGKNWKHHATIGILLFSMSVLCAVGIVPYILSFD